MNHSLRSFDESKRYTFLDESLRLVRKNKKEILFCHPQLDCGSRVYIIVSGFLVKPGMTVEY